jgi:hypothetical protein
MIAGPDQGPGSNFRHWQERGEEHESQKGDYQRECFEQTFKFSFD